LHVYRLVASLYVQQHIYVQASMCII